MNEIFRYLIMFAICYYYCDRSSGLLKSRRQLLKILKIMGIISVTLISTFGIIVGIKVGTSSNYPLCKAWEFQSFRYYSILTCIFFLYIYVQIRKSILAHPRETQLDIRVLDYQMDTLNKLRGSFIVLIVVSLILIILDIIAKMTADENGAQFCNSTFKYAWINTVYYFFTRALASQSAIVPCIYLFFKSWSTLSKKKVLD